MTATPSGAPHVRIAGSGPRVVCLHANASSSAQWRHLSELLAPRFQVVAPDLYGVGGTPEWPSDRVITLADEAALIEPLLAPAPGPIALVGHSYGAAVALKAALADPSRIAALVVYEPTLFAFIEQASPRPNDADGIRDAVADAAAALDTGDRFGAARSFIDYWSGTGAWDAVPEQRKPQVAAQVANVRRARRPGSLSHRRAIDRVGTRRDEAARAEAAARRGRRVRRARPHGPGDRPGDGRSGH